MLLAIDIGNTNIKLGLFKGNSLRKVSISLADCASFGEKIGEFIKLHIDSDPNIWIPAFAGMTEKRQFTLGMTEKKQSNPEITEKRQSNPDLSFPRKRESSSTSIEAVMVSSVVPDMTGKICSIISPYFAGQPHIVSHSTNSGLSFSVPYPQHVGADRITAATWAYHHFGGPAAVIDFGTATTISVVGQGGQFIGGAIIPGLRTMALAFNEHTAALPLVELEAPEGALGKDTRSAIISGIVYGTAGAVSRIIYEIQREIGYNINIAATGGGLALIEICLERVDVVEPDLLLLGLRMIYERMKQLGC